jgi:hypothetical protein
MATQYTPQEIEAWKLEMDYLRMDRGEVVALIGSTLTDEPHSIPLSSDGRISVGPGAYKRTAPKIKQ